MAKFNYDALSTPDKKKFILACKANGTTMSLDGSITKVPDAVVDFSEEYITTINGANIVLNNVGDLMFHISVNSPAKFLSQQTGAMEDLHTFRMNPINILTDLGIFREDNIFEDIELEDHRLNVLCRLLKRLEVTINISVSEIDGVFSSVTDPMITGDANRIESATTKLFPRTGDILSM